MSLTRHLLAVWNPSYARNAMEEHLAVLLRSIAQDDDAYVWWGRVRSTHRRSELPHVAEIKEIDRILESQTDDDETETHLYLTDYRSLYVGDLTEITFEPLGDAEQSHVPAYYTQDHLDCDCWFKLADVRRLVSNDMSATIAQLRKLNNVHYFDQPVSLYGGIVNLPLIVTRPDGLRFFDPGERDLDTDASTWAEFDAKIGAKVGEIGRSLSDDLLGELSWRAFDPTVQSFIATAEKIYRDNRADPAFDFSPVILSLSKAVEVHLGGVIRMACTRMPSLLRRMNVDGVTVDLKEARGLSLQSLIHALSGDEDRRQMLVSTLSHGQWLTGVFVAVLDEFRQVRNDATHSKRVDEQTAKHLRNGFFGVGSEGHLVQLAKVKLR